MGFTGIYMITCDGGITGCTVTPASGEACEALWELTEGSLGLVIGDKMYPRTFPQAEWATVHLDSQTPLRLNITDSRPPWVVQQLPAPAAAWKPLSGNWPSSFTLRKSGRGTLGIGPVGSPEKCWRTPWVSS